MRSSLILILFLALIFACKSKQKASENANVSSEETVEEVVENTQEEQSVKKKVAIDLPSEAVARIQRTACFGRCPIYVLTVYKDGTVIYNAEKWVDKEGTFQAKASTELFQKLLKKAEEIGYFSLDDLYDSDGVTDLPSTITTIRSEEDLKQIVNRYQGPEKLADFEQYFDSLYLSLEWSEQDTE